MNIAHYLEENARTMPWKRAVVFPHTRAPRGRTAYTHLTFKQLNERTDRFAAGLKAYGVQPGMRTLLMVRPGLDFVALTFALFKIGAVPVLIDPGMGVKSFLRCVQQVEPEAMLGIRLAHILKKVRPRFFRTVRIPVLLGRKMLPGGLDTDSIPPAQKPFEMAAADDADTAAVLFTTGSTGPAKGVVYTHGIFNAQVEILRRQYGIGADDVDLPCFPLFALFSIALGATAVIPDMDPTRPADVDPQRIIEAVEDHGVTYSFGSPALWRTVGAFCKKNGVQFPSLKRVFMAGAPVPAYLHECMLGSVIPGGEVHTPYGATESLPIASFTGSEMLRETREKSSRGAGICVGHPVDKAVIKIIRISDEPIPQWDDSLALPQGEIGEIVVKAPVVTPEYFRLPEHTALAKIHENGHLWHRMGDVGYIDADGRIWFCGRKSHRVNTESGEMYTVPCEAVINEHPDVYRSALVGIGEGSVKTPVIIVEPEPGKFPKTRDAEKAFAAEILKTAAGNELTAPIRQVLFHPAFPVDIRHNAKIRREVLTDWADKRVAG